MEGQAQTAPAEPAVLDAGALPARGPSRFDLGLLALIGLLTLAHVAYYFPRVVDDLFISLRFAENLAQGRGAVYDVGERVEGYSSPLWMFLQALGLFFRIEGVTWTKLLGVASLLGLSYGLFRLARDAFGIRGPAALIPSFSCACNSYVVNWAVLGLETPVHLMLLALCPLSIHLAWTTPTPARRIFAAVSIVGLGLSRPESPLYLALILGAPLLAERRVAAVRRTALSMVQLAAPALGVLAVLLIARRAYYGYWVPNTYFVKGSGEGFDLRRLEPLFGQGASASEAALYLGGTVLLLHYAVVRRAAAPALIAVACLYFTASVRLDWMPSLRHHLPITVLAPLGFACLADDLLRRTRSVVRALAVVPVLVPALAAASVVPIDNRNSPEESRGRGWIRPKTLSKWKDTVLSYRRVEPPHVRRMGPYEMGQITQAWHVLEASEAPVGESWYIGRDIGAVGYYTGAKVYDTAGLFTHEVSHSEEWTRKHVVTDALIRSAMSRRPLAGEIYEGWELALGRHPELLRGYRIRRGSARMPVAFLATDRVPPSHEEIVRRYRAMVDKFPKLYHLHTLYGESLGAVVEKRLRVVETGRRPTPLP